MFDTWTDAETRAKVVTPEWVATNRRLFDGDHWLDGLGWSGPRPAADDQSAQAVLGEIKRAFISSNKVAETVKRHANAVIGKEPAWGFAPVRALADDEQPSADEQARIGEAEAALTSLWDTRGPHRALQHALRAGVGMRISRSPGCGVGCVNATLPFAVHLQLNTTARAEVHYGSR